ncbi:MAG: pyridoxamine 5'-phosphate oxidase family protein [Pseudolabrys sp.]|jgi:nitroimidazol reductase NimA-like FMN-containing flavoprotein (pyridoxamine 5'-phosphate oxidase superfamily)
MKQEFKRQIVELLDRHRIMTVATNREDGWPQATVVSYANDGLIVYCQIARNTQKYTNILRDPRVSLAIAKDVPQPLQIKGLSIAARAEEVADTGERDHAAELILARYPEYKVMPRPDPTAVPTLRLTPEIVAAVDYSKGFGHSDLVKVTDADLAEFVEARRHHWAGFHPA